MNQPAEVRFTAKRAAIWSPAIGRWKTIARATAEAMIATGEAVELRQGQVDAPLIPSPVPNTPHEEKHPMDEIQYVRTDRNHSGIPGATVAFAATLTATSNEYLAPHLPARGLVQIGERSIYGDCIRVQFAREIDPGIWGAFVACPDAQFTFESRV